MSARWYSVAALLLCGILVLAASVGSGGAAAVAPEPGQQGTSIPTLLEQPGPPLAPVAGPALPAGLRPGGTPVRAESRSVAQLETITVAPKATHEQDRRVSTQPSQQAEYTWQDGDRTLRVTLQTDLALEEHSGGVPRSAFGDTPNGAIVKSTGVGRSTRLPVFRSQSGTLMTLPGGVLLVLNEGWSQSQVNSFFSSHGIQKDKASDLGWIDNGYLIDTEPGFPSLTLANRLAGQKGVIVSSPNWWQEVTLN